MATIRLSNAGGNYNASGTWDGGVVPTSADDVIADASSGNLTVNVSSNCRTIDFTSGSNYAGTLTMTAALLVGSQTASGTTGVTLSPAMTIAGSANLTLIAGSGGTGTLTSNGKTWPTTLNVSGFTITVTLADDWTVGGFSFAGTTQICTFNDRNLYVQGSCTASVSSGAVAGTTVFHLIGTGNLGTTGVSSGNPGGFRVNLVINTSGTITVQSVFAFNGAVTLTYTAGTVIATGATLRLLGTSGTTINAAGIAWQAISLTTFTGTITLADDLNAGNFSSSSANVIQTINGPNINLTGSCTANSMTTGSIVGTATIRLIGTGTFETTNVASNSGGFRCNVVINTAGTITVGSRLAAGGASSTFTYTAGTVITTGSTLRLLSGGIYAVSGINWNNLQILSGAVTCTLTEQLNAATFDSTTDTSTHTLNGSDLVLSGSLTAPAMTSGTITGTSTIRLVGTGTWSASASLSSGGIRNNLVIDTAGTITISGRVGYSTGILTYTAGTVVATGSTLVVRFGTTLNTSGISWDNFEMRTDAATITLASTFTVTGTFARLGDTTTQTFNGSPIQFSGSAITANAMTSGQIAGTSTLHINSAGTISTSALTTGRIALPIQINTTQTITLGSFARFGTLAVPAGVASTFGGSFGWEAQTLSVAAGAARNVTFQAGRTYTITNNLTASNATFRSSSPGTYSNVTLAGGASQSLTNVNASWIDSSGGQTISTFRGQLDNTVNWNVTGDESASIFTSSIFNSPTLQSSGVLCGA